MKIAVIGRDRAHRIAGSQHPERERPPSRAALAGVGPGPAQRAGPAGIAGRGGCCRQPDELADLRRRFACVLTDDHRQPADGRESRQRAPRRHPLDRGRRPGAALGLLPCQGAAGRHPQGRTCAVLDRPRHSVLRVHERGNIRKRRRDHPPPACNTDPADGVGRRRPGSCRCQRRPPATGHAGDRRPRRLRARRTRPHHPRRPRRSSRCRHRQRRWHVRPASGDALIAKDGTVIAKTSYPEWLTG